MTWHVTHYDDDTGYAYRVRVKRLTVGDAVRADMLGDDISRRDDALTGREYLILVQVYPFIKSCTVVCERGILDNPPTETGESGDPIIPDDAGWEAFDLTEAVFMDLPEWLVLRWQHEAIQKNPHRDPTYDLLKKKALRAPLPPASPASLPDDDNSATTSAPASDSA
jgi:hypothetical protein